MLTFSCLDLDVDFEILLFTIFMIFVDLVYANIFMFLYVTGLTNDNTNFHIFVYLLCSQIVGWKSLHPLS